MGYFDHMNDGKSVTYITKCLNCGTKLRITEEDQTPGFRETEACHCPVCKTLLAESRLVDFYVSVE